VGGRQGIACRARWTGRGALAASRADPGVDFDVIAIRCDRPGRAKVETAVTTGQLRARMDADFCAEIHIFRLVEAADKIARLEHRTQHCGRISRVRAEIAVAQVMGGEKWRTAGKIKDEVAARSQAVARSLKDE